MKYKEQLLLSMRIGDGNYVTQTTEVLRFGEYRYSVSTYSKNIEYVLLKKKELEKLGIKIGNIRTTKSGYKEDSVIYTINTRVHPLLTKIGNMKKIDIIKNLDKCGLIYYYLDDGSWHKGNKAMHLYCNSFNEDEVNELINKIYETYPIKKCSKRIDRKKDGRTFPYLYIPKIVVDEFKKDIYQFLIENKLDCFLYKVGFPSTTIETA